MLDISNFLVACNSATNFLVYWNSEKSLGSTRSNDKQSKTTIGGRSSGGRSSRSLLMDSYSHQELQMLSMSYIDLWRTPDEESGLNLGQRLLASFLEIKPDLALTLGIHNVASEDWPKCTRLLTLGNQIGSFFCSLIRISQRESLIKESRSLGRHHHELGKTIV